MALTEEEKRERNRLAAARYRRRQKEKIAAGDSKAQKQAQKTAAIKRYSSLKSYIKLHATKQQLSELRDLIAARQKELLKEEKKK